jgi:hypothetical protein
MIMKYRGGARRYFPAIENVSGLAGLKNEKYTIRRTAQIYKIAAVLTA